jgi:hypothetical protein
LPLLQRSTRAVYWRRLRSGVLNAGGDGRCESLGPCLVGGTSVLGTGWRTGRIVVGPNECWKLTVARQVPRRELMESTGPDRLPAERWAEVMASDREVVGAGVRRAVGAWWSRPLTEDAARQLYGSAADSAWRFPVRSGARPGQPGCR